MFRQKLQQFMIGRYGVDQLGIFLTVTALICSLLASLLGLGILSVLATVLLVYSIFRMYSRNITARYQENQKFMPYWRKISRFLPSVYLDLLFICYIYHQFFAYYT